MYIPVINKPDKFCFQRKKDGSVQLQLNNKYELQPTHDYCQPIVYLIKLINQKNQDICKQFQKVPNISYYPSLQFVLSKSKMEDQKCIICLQVFTIKEIQKELQRTFDDDVVQLSCSHLYHKSCLQDMIGGKQWVKCAVCATIFGGMIGQQPDGTMKHYVDNQITCEGYSKGTIIINYSFPNGIKNGKSYAGTTRRAYLPNNAQGQQVLNLLKIAFDRKLVFTIGRSVTTGMDNQTVWNGVHHKTSVNGGSANYGYPDQTYLKRIKEELAAKGITKNCMK